MATRKLTDRIKKAQRRRRSRPRDPVTQRFVAYRGLPDQLTLTCANCGKRFPASRAQRWHFNSRKYGCVCSQHCAGAVRHKGTDPVLLTCANCGKHFYASRGQRSALRHPQRELKYGHCCSRRCATLVGHKHRTPAHQVSAREFARLIVGQALRDGVLARPDTCQRCGAKPGLDSAGRSKIHGHHRDYNKPLEVEWICVRCHNNDDHHRRPRGDEHRWSILTEAQVREIRALLRQGVPQRKIGASFGVSKATVAAIKARRNWRHVNG